MKSENILIIDDDQELRKLLHRLLEKHGFNVIEAEDGTAIFDILQKNNIDLILLDIMLEKEDGFIVCRKLREKSSIPIIMITAMDDAADRVVGLELGADDYITKPFYPREVVARIKSVLRRCNQTTETLPIETSKEIKICFAGWTLLPQQRRLFSASNVEVSLSAGEYVLLEVFLNRPNCVLTREQLLDHMHGENFDIFDRSVDVQISRLRKRIEPNPKNPTLIKTVRSGGYMFDAEVQELSI